MPARFALTRTSAVLSGFFLFSHAAMAGAPMQKFSAPGFYRIMLGNFEITALSDGTADLPIEKILTNIKAPQLQQALSYAHLQTPLETSINAYLINTGTKLILIDAGTKDWFGPTLGKLSKNLKAAGYQPEQVDEIYITHFHADHVGGLSDNEQRLFPNAIVRAEKKEADYWLSEKNLAQAQGDVKQGFTAAQASVQPYVKAGKFQPFSGDTELSPGIHARVTYGHTPGHSYYEIQSGGKKMLVIGDMIHVGAVQFAAPKVTVSFDDDSKTAAKARLTLFAQAAKEGSLIAAAHISFPGIGYLRSQGQGYRWLPLNHTEAR